MEKRSAGQPPTGRIELMDNPGCLRFVVSAPFLAPGLSIITFAMLGFAFTTLVGASQLAAGRWREVGMSATEAIGSQMMPGAFVVANALATLALLAILLFHVFGELEVTLDGEQLSVRWLLWGRGITKRMPADEIGEIREGWVGRSNSERIYGVVVVPKNPPMVSGLGGPELRFGGILDREERLWVMRKLRAALDNRRELPGLE